MTRPIRPTAALIALGGLLLATGAAAQPWAMHGHHGGGGIDFEAIDTDGNGTLVRAELVARATEGLSAADTNGDGALDRQEIMLAMPGPHGPFVHLFSADPAEGRADRLLAELGATEAGRVTIEALAGQRVNDLLVWVDTDRDAAISLEEAEAFQSRREERHRGGHGRGGDRHDDDGDDGRG